MWLGCFAGAGELLQAVGQSCGVLRVEDNLVEGKGEEQK